MMVAGVCVRMCVWMDYGRGGRYGARRRRRHVNRRQRRLGLRCVEAMAVTCYQAVMAAPAAGRGMTVMMMPEDDPREGHGSLMMLRRAVRVMRLRDHVVTRGWCVRGARMVMTAGCRVVIRIIGAAAIVVVILLLGLPLAVLLVLHPTVLKPDLDLALGQIQVARELPSLLFRHVSVEEKFFLQLESLKLGVRLAFLPHRHLARPFQGVGAAAPDTHPDTNPDSHTRKRTCGKQGRWGGTPHHWRWVGARSNRFGRSVGASQTAVSIVRKGTIRSNHSGSDPTTVIRRGWRQIRYPRLRMRMMMSSRVNRMVMPRRRVWPVIAPALREALMTGRHGWIGGAGGTGGGSTGTRRRSCRAGRIVGLVIRGRAGGTGRSSGGCRGRPKQPGLPVVPGGTGGRGGIGRQVVVRGGIVTPVSLMMVQRFARRGRVVGVLGMVRTVTPAALRPCRVRVPYHACCARTAWRA